MPGNTRWPASANAGRTDAQVPFAGVATPAIRSADVLAILLVGGAGERLFPLTRDHAKPMLPIGGIYRLIDITLSNCVNSGLRKVYILTQHRALSLNRHVRDTWNILPPQLGEFIEIFPPTKRVRETWYLGTADAVYQNIRSIKEEGLQFVLVLSADHIYMMNYMHMLEWHLARGTDVTLATTQIPPCEAGRFGIVRIEDDFQIGAFDEKPRDHADRSAFNPEMCSASMGVYLFSTAALLDALYDNAKACESGHDFGRDILPARMGRRRVFAYDFVDENRKEMRYWRDVGTLNAYYEANMDLVAVSPVFNLYDSEWPVRTVPPNHPPAKFVFADEGRRMGVALDSLVSNGCIVSGGRVTNSVLSPGVRIDSYSEIDRSILLHNVQLGRHCRIRHAIIDQRVQVPEDSQIGCEPEADRQTGHFVTDSGLVAVHTEKGVLDADAED